MTGWSVSAFFLRHEGSSQWVLCLARTWCDRAERKQRFGVIDEGPERQAVAVCARRASAGDGHGGELFVQDCARGGRQAMRRRGQLRELRVHHRADLFQPSREARLVGRRVLQDDDRPGVR
jgi:hypothetical protein